MSGDSSKWWLQTLSASRPALTRRSYRLPEPVCGNVTSSLDDRPLTAIGRPLNESEACNAANAARLRLWRNHALPEQTPI